MEESISQKLKNLPVERRWREQQYPAPAVVALIRQTFEPGKDGDLLSKYLLIQRNGEPYNGCWALVGGKWEFGEMLSEAITREVKEETGLDATFVAARGLVSERVLPAGNRASGAHYLLFVCELAADGGVATEQDEGVVSWFTREEIEDLHAKEAIIPSDYAMINSFVDARAAMPHVEAEMRAPIGQTNDAPIQMLRYEHINSLGYDDEQEAH